MRTAVSRVRDMIRIGCLAGMLPASGAAAPAAPKQEETIVYVHRPGGLCPDYSFKGCTPFTVTLPGDGRGVVAVTDDRGRHDWPFQASDVEQHAFRNRLKLYRRRNDNRLVGSPACRSVMTDGDTIEVTWRRGDRVTAHVALNGGCLFPGKDKMLAALVSAPPLLPIADRIGPH